MDVTLIIPQFQHSELTLAGVASIRRHETARWPVIVVDDGSAPAHRALPRDLDPNTRFVSVRHRGVTAAWNIGITLATTTWIVLVNNDVLWSGPAVESLLRPLYDSAAVIAGVEWRNERWWPPGLVPTLSPQPLLAGWCWAFRKQTWRELGGFDESLALYFSDTDFQLRALLNGRRLRAKGLGSTAGSEDLDTHCARLALGTWPDAPGPPLHHAAHQTVSLLPDRREQWERDRRRFLEKWS